MPALDERVRDGQLTLFTSSPADDAPIDLYPVDLDQPIPYEVVGPDDCPELPSTCVRWSRSVDRDVSAMPAVGASLEAWLAWYRSCGCALCATVAGELSAAARSSERG